MQGSLPDGDAECDKTLRGVKSKAMYGKIREEVDRIKVIDLSLTAPLTPAIKLSRFLFCPFHLHHGYATTATLFSTLF